VLLRRAWYGLNQAFRRRIAGSGFTPDQFTVLRTIRERPAGALTQRELSELMGSDPNTVASLLKRMEQLGWVGRERDPGDRRAHRLGLTPEGRAAYGRLRREAVALQAEAMESLPPAERERFLEMLEAVAETCQTLAVSADRAADSRASGGSGAGGRRRTAPRTCR
jgi:DNA-binding MarR family transcriptional regulator